MVKLSVTVMTIPERLDNAKNLLSSCPSSIHSQICSDITYQGLWYNAKRSWQSFPPDSTHHLVLQDDVELHPQFWQFIQSTALPLLPNSPLTFFQGFQAQSFTSPSHWITLDGVFTSQANLLPVPIIKKWLLWDSLKFTQNPKTTWDDERLKLFCKAHSLKVWMTYPEIVQHLTQKYPSTHQVVSQHVSQTYNPDRNILSLDWSISNPPFYELATYPIVLRKILKHDS